MNFEAWLSTLMTKESESKTTPRNSCPINKSISLSPFSPFPINEFREWADFYKSKGEVQSYGASRTTIGGFTTSSSMGPCTPHSPPSTCYVCSTGYIRQTPIIQRRMGHGATSMPPNACVTGTSNSTSILSLGAHQRTRAAYDQPQAQPPTNYLQSLWTERHSTRLTSI